MQAWLFDQVLRMSACLAGWDRILGSYMVWEMVFTKLMFQCFAEVLGP